MPGNSSIAEMADACLMGRTRMLNRMLTGIYDEALRPFGIKASQFNLLLVTAKLSPVRRTDIGRLIQIDASTLTRNLKVMLNNGWIEDLADDGDGRGKLVRVTGAGVALLQSLQPAWQAAQSKAEKRLGAKGAGLLHALSDELLAQASG